MPGPHGPGAAVSSLRLFLGLLGWTVRSSQPEAWENSLEKFGDVFFTFFFNADLDSFAALGRRNENTWGSTESIHIWKCVR